MSSDSGAVPTKRESPGFSRGECQYEALEAWDREQVLGPLIGFLKEQTAKTWQKQIKIAERKNSEPER